MQYMIDAFTLMCAITLILDIGFHVVEDASEVLKIRRKI